MLISLHLEGVPTTPSLRCSVRREIPLCTQHISVPIRLEWALLSTHPRTRTSPAAAWFQHCIACCHLHNKAGSQQNSTLPAPYCTPAPSAPWEDHQLPSPSMLPAQPTLP